MALSGITPKQKLAIAHSSLLLISVENGGITSPNGYELKMAEKQPISVSEKN